MKNRITPADLSIVVTAWSDTLSIDPRSGESIVTAQDLYRLECSLSTLAEDRPYPKPNLLSRFIKWAKAAAHRSTNEQ